MTSQLTIADALAADGIARATEASDPDAITALDQLPEGIRPAAIGGRFRHAARQGLIRPVGYVASTDPRTHGHPVRVCQGRSA